VGMGSSTGVGSGPSGMGGWLAISFLLCPAKNARGNRKVRDRHAIVMFRMQTGPEMQTPGLPLVR
jgi:hypothetical protein